MGHNSLLQFLQVINTLLEAGVDKDCATAEKWSPLHAAAEKGKLEAVRTLQVRCRFLWVRKGPFWDPSGNRTTQWVTGWWFDFF